MAFDPTLGLSLDGKQLQPIPPNASNDQQIAALNDIIGKLNNNSQETVGSASVRCTLTGAAQDVFTFPHDLGYVPRPYAYLDKVTFTIGGLVYPNVNLPLPTYLGSSITGVGGGGGSASVTFSSWLDCFTDTTNIYIHFNNPNALAGVLPITYYLTREAAN